MSQNAMIHVPKHDEYSHRQVNMPFGHFLEELLSRQPSPRTTQTDIVQAIWTGPPLEQMVANGLMVLIYKLSNGQARTLQAIEAQATKLDHMLCIGLMVSFPDTHAAVNHFEETVLRPLQQQVQTLTDGYTAPLQEMWLPLIAGFFAALIKDAKEYARKCCHAYEEIRRLNRPKGYAAVEQESVTYTRAVDILHEAVEYLRIILVETDVTANESWNTKRLRHPPYQELRTLDVRLQTNLKRVHALRKIPYRFGAIPAAARLYHGTIDTNWVEVLALRTAADMSDMDYIDSVDYVLALSAVRNASPRQLAEQALGRLRTRGARLSTVENDLLIELFAKRITKLQKHPAHLAADQLYRAFILTAHSEESLSAKDALRLAIEGTHVDGFDPAALARKIDWQAVTVRDFVYLLNAENLPLPEYGRGIVLARRCHQPAMIDKLLGWERATPECIEPLLEANLVRITPDFAREHTSLIPPTYLTATFRDLLRQSESSETIFRIAERLPDDDGKQIFSDPAIRRQLTDHISELIDGTDIRTPLTRKLKHLMGEDLWFHFVLACQLLIRIAEYSGEDSLNGDAEPFLSWEELLRNPNAVTSARKLMFVLDIHPITAETLLLRLTEDRIFKWLHEGHSKTQQRQSTSAFNRQRTAYWKRRKQKQTTR